MEAERDPEASPYITVQPRERHLAAMASEEEDLLVFELDGRRVGYARLSGRLARRHGNVEIQTLVITERGRGLGTRAIELILKREFGELGRHRVWLDAIGTNERALHTYEKLGFAREGAMREAWRLPDGGYDSIVLLSILDREWAELSGP
jgi:RimJ/RimL family protein N-acetyltransferase